MSTDTAPSHRRSYTPAVRIGWTPATEQKMVEMLRAKVPYKEIATTLGRTLASIQVRLSYMRKADPTIPGCRCPQERAVAIQEEPTEFMRRAKPGRETKTDVERRARKLTDIWRRRGYETAAFWVVSISKDAGDHQVYEIRSNLVNGLPPKQHPAIRQSTAAE